jgi:hypothetical protein
MARTRKNQRRKIRGGEEPKQPWETDPRFVGKNVPDEVRVFLIRLLDAAHAKDSKTFENPENKYDIVINDLKSALGAREAKRKAAGQSTLFARVAKYASGDGTGISTEDAQKLLENLACEGKIETSKLESLYEKLNDAKHYIAVNSDKKAPFCPGKANPERAAAAQAADQKRAELDAMEQRRKSQQFWGTAGGRKRTKRRSTLTRRRKH